MPALTDAQRREFEDHGFLLLPALFSEEEIAPLRAEVETVAAREGPEVVAEAESDEVGSSTAPIASTMRSIASPAIPAGWSRRRS